MKRLKSFVSFVLALVMVFAMTTTAFAAETGSITIENPVAEQEYDIYLMFELESYNSATGAYSYKVAEGWANFIAEKGAGAAYLEENEAGYVVWKDGVEKSAANVAKLAKDALAYAEANEIEPTATLNGDKNYNATGLTLGYYLVDSSLGTICGLTTTKPDATVKEKNPEPTVKKEVLENVDGDKTYTDGVYGNTNDAEIGEKVDYKTTITAEPGAAGYILHDKMSVGLSFNNDVVVKVGDTTLTADTDYTVNTECSDKCTFEITFKQSYLDTITAETEIVITYSATLNDDAVISTDPNTNETKLTYGEDIQKDTEWDKTETFTYKFDLVKTKEDNVVLEGAEFELYDAAENGNKISLVAVNEENNIYRVATKEEAEVEGFESAVIKAGQATIKGLDSGKYYLEEITAPEGYNKLTGRVEVVISGENLDASVTPAGMEVEGETLTDDTYVSGGIQVINKTGAELPSTGGIGTTVFYVIGGVLVVGAAVLLVSKKRMGNEE